MASLLASLIPGLIPQVGNVVGSIFGGNKKKRPMPEMAEGFKRRKGKGFKSFGKKMLANPLTQGMLFNTGMDLSGRLINAISGNNDQGYGCGKRKSKKFMLSHGLGVAPAVPFGGLIIAPQNYNRYRQAPRGINNTQQAGPLVPTKTIAPRNNVTPSAPPYPNSINKKQAPLASSQSILPSISSTPKVVPMIRPPLSANPNKTLKSRLNKIKKSVKRIGRQGARKIKTTAQKLRKTLPGTLKQLAHPKAYTRKIARKVALKSENAIHKLEKKTSNPKVKRLLNKTKKVVHAVDRYGQRGNMGTKPYNIKNKIKNVSKKIKTTAKKIHKQAKPTFHAGRKFIKSKINKPRGNGMPYLPGPLA